MKWTKFRWIAVVLSWVLLAASAIVIAATGYKSHFYKDSQIQEIIFYLDNDLSGGNIEEFTGALVRFSPLIVLLTLVLGLPLLKVFRARIWVRIRGRVLRFNPGSADQIGGLKMVGYSVVVFLVSLSMLAYALAVPKYVVGMFSKSDLFEKHYVDPKGVDLKFPEKPRNLVFIYLESMETSVASKKAGGKADKSLIPELEKAALAPENVSFSNRYPKLGGAVQPPGTGWSLAGVSSMTGGIPILNPKMQYANTHFGKFYSNQFMPGAYMLGEVLRDHNYNTSFILAADAGFGGLRTMLDTHGSYRILDKTSLKAQGRLPQDYKVFWGFEDKKLFKFAKEELAELSAKPKPFAVTLFTADTHSPEGWLDPSCPKVHDNGYKNVHLCSSKMVDEFVGWVQSQPFGANTTIILTGDHLGMAGWFYEGLKAKEEDRNVYNVFINPAVRPEEQRSRQFTTMDMYPTTLAALGVTIPGQRLGLGTNLFSRKSTLIEEYGGLEPFSNELSKRSDFYDNKILSVPE